MKKTYHGSCHCGRVRFEVAMDLNEGTGKCNCTICTKSRFWGILVKPEDFKLLAGEDALSDYQFSRRLTHHQFCRTCGVKTFVHGHIKEVGGAFYSVSLNCLDDIDASELAEAPVQFFDGRNDAWRLSPPETRHL
ncbi:aldehyde-activating protein [Hahella sp. CCB-MM4]|nr:aldehyde-activating protein [Hahella sp. CCB-MM4]